MTTTCVRCGAEQTDGAYACRRCGIDRPAAQLGDIRDMATAARDVAQRLATRDTPASTGKPGSQLPLDLSATSRLDAVQNALTTLARDIVETRGAQTAPTAAMRLTYPEPLIRIAQWLTGQLEWLRHATNGDHEPWATHALGEIEAAARIVAGIARGPGAQRYLGPCGAMVGLLPNPVELPDVLVTVECEGDIYARVYADGTTSTTGICRTCQATVATAERQTWLDDQVREHNFRAAHIADAFGINVKTIRTWHLRGLLIAHGEDRDSRPLFNVGDVLDLARALAVRRAERQAERARRTTEIEGAA